MPMNELALMAAMGSASATLELTASKTLVQHLTEMYLQEQMAMINFGVAGEAPMPAEQLQAQAELQASMMVLGLSAQSIIIDSGDNWTTQITYGNGGITANGQPLPFGF
jgi:uncharacterized protein YdgA (DUF945 family)